jgi:signal transduction histidine kinase/DNA-binding response OmpR family regulator
MDKPLRILHLEDSPKDAELIEATLAGEGLACEVALVDTREDFLAALEQGGFDLILVDYGLTSFDGLSALRIAKEKCPLVPFILVSGTVGEELAIESLKLGATDYVLKHRLSRLVSCTKRALREVEEMRERRRAEDEVKHNLERIRALHEIDLAITSTLDLRTILDVLLEKIDLFLVYPTASTIRLLNKESGALEPVACRNLNEVVWKADEWKSGRGPANTVFQDKALLMVGNVQTDPRIRDREFFQRYGLVSYLGVPLIAKREVLGVLGLYTKKEHEFGAEEIEFFNTLAGQAAIAINNAQLYEEMVRANRIKNEFLSVMSHELRTPLSVVMGYTGLVKDGSLGPVNKQQAEALGKVLGRAGDQLSMINEIMQTTQLEARAMSVNHESFDLRDLLDQLRLDYEVRADKQNVRLIWHYPAAGMPITTDGVKLKQILQNLIKNALKFTDEGAVTISVRIVDESSKREETQPSAAVSRLSPLPAKSVEFKVQDTGIGIPKEKHETIFNKFHQVDSSETRLYGGVGLGLYIVKNFTELLGGKIKVDSEEGKGSTFTVTVPVRGVTP